MVSAVEAAARNNAHWCDVFCRTHGVSGVFGAEQWTSTRRTPPLYPDAVTLAPTASTDSLLSRIDTSSGCSVKDSFANLDLAPAGFRVLFDAEWIRHEPPAPTPDSATCSFSVIATPGHLDAWEHGWRDGETATRAFLPTLLSLESVVMFGQLEGDGVSAGVVAHLSHGCVGISNFFAHGDRDGAWGSCISTVAHAFPGLPIVGYESGADLESSRGQGFVTLGPLRVWLSS